MHLKNGQTLLFTGDSITDCGRARPLGEGEGLGEGYVRFFDARLAAAHPDLRVRVLNTGIGGNRVTDLEARWQQDVLEHRPDWLSVLIGINDVWRHHDQHAVEFQVGPDMFEERYRALIQPLRPRLDGLILMTPYYLESNRDDPMRAQMDRYGDIVRRLAAEHDALCIDLQADFDRYLEHRDATGISGDRIHLNLTGNLLLVEALWRTLVLG